MNMTFSTLPGAKTIGNYIVGKKEDMIGKNLGQGTFGKVKLGIQSQTQQKVAIKILQKSKISDVADVERVTREIQILKQVRHPNIIQLYEIIETPRQLFLIMEYVSQGQLFEYIVKKKRLKQHEACQYFQQIIAAVEYLHTLGIVHRDLKPENLLLDFNRRIKLVDFGLSNTYKHKQFLKTACGSPCYAAPEMIAGKKYEGLMADIWSCGIILFAMVCGYLPFEDPNTSLLYKKIMAGEFNIPKYVSPLCKQFLRSLLTTDPHRRITLAQIKQHEWFKQIKNNQFYNFQLPPMGIKVSQQLIPYDEAVVQQMKQYQQKVSAQQIKKMIANNRHNHTVTIYYLMMKRNLKTGIDSKYDINSSLFDKSVLMERTEIAAPSDNVRKSVTKYQRDLSKDSKDSHPNNKTIDEIDLRTTTTSNGFRLGSRTLNRVQFRDKDNLEKNKLQFNLQNTNKNANTIHNPFNQTMYPKRNQEVSEAKIDLQSIPNIDNIVKLNQKKRKINLQNTHRTKREDLIDLYGADDMFRNTMYVPKPYSTTNSPARTPISFRTSLERYKYKKQTKVKQDKFLSLDITENQEQSKEIKKENNKTQKQRMNKTFMGKFTTINSSIPKYEDTNDKQRIRSILNKTISRNGSRNGKNRRNQDKQLSLQYY